MGDISQDVTHQKPILVTDIVGNIGKYQIAVLAYYFYWAAITGTSGVTVQLLAPIVTMYWDWDTPYANRTTFLSTDCKMDDVLDLNKTSRRSNATSKLVYESQYSKRTLTEEMKLVCEESWLISFANSGLMVGSLVGNFAGRLSEKFGRRSCIMCFGVLNILSNVLILLSSGSIMLLFSVFLLGLSSVPASVLVFVQAAEIIPASKIPYFGTLGRFGLIFGQTVMVGVAWAVEDWFYLQAFQTAFAGLLLLVSWYFLESPVWLAVRAKYKESHDTLSRIVQRNGRDLSVLEPKIAAWVQQMKDHHEAQRKEEKGHCSDLFKNRTITFYTCGSCFIMLFVNCIFYGVTMNTESFGSGMYEDLTISNGLSVASVLVTLVALTKLSLRVIIITFILLEGAVCIVYPLLYKIPIARSILTILSRSFMAPSSTTSFAYITGLFPTSVRALGVAFTSMISRLFTIAVPFTKELAEKTVPYLPFILFGALSFASALIMKLLPETKGKPLAHTAEDLRLKERKNQETATTRF